MPFIGNKPSAVPLTSADIADGIITSAKIVDATIANADIANSTINLTTKVTGTLPVANGGTGLATLGTASQELRVNSGATALEYYTPTVASSDFVLLATTDVTSSTASVSFDGYFSSTYKNYKVIISNLIGVTTNVNFNIRFRRSNADITSANYFNAGGGGRVYSGDDSYAQNGIGTYSATFLNLGNAQANGTSFSQNVELILYNPLSTSFYKTINCITNSVYISGGEIYTYGSVIGGGLRDSASALSGVTFLMSSGNISNGNFKLYGLK